MSCVGRPPGRPFFLKIRLMMADRLVGLSGFKRGIQVCHLQGMVSGLVPDGEKVSVGSDQVGDAGILE